MKALTAIFLISTTLGVIGMLVVKRHSSKKIKDVDEKMLFNYYLMLSQELS